MADRFLFPLHLRHCCRLLDSLVSGLYELVIWCMGFFMVVGTLVFGVSLRHN